jgi:sensor histidine kinase YesM
MQKIRLSRFSAVSLHILFWAFYLLLPYILHNPQERADRYKFWAGRSTIMNLFWLIFFYANAFVFIPRVLKNWGVVGYILTLAGSSIAIFVLGNFITLEFFPDKEFVWKSYTPFIFSFISFLAMSSSYRIIADNVVKERLRKEKESEALKTELSFLRSQVSPHFMFNVLNNLVALARLKSNQIEPSLIKLSQLMRYMLYDSDQETISLEKEVEYLRSYIDLQHLRFGEDVKVNLETEGQLAGRMIEPMLLIPFVENAFKHGMGMIKDPFINIHLKANNEGLQFVVSNKVSPEADVKDKSSGIGLNNVKRRLELLYKKYQLETGEKGNIYTATLKIFWK